MMMFVFDVIIGLPLQPVFVATDLQQPSLLIFQIPLHFQFSCHMGIGENVNFSF